MFPSTAASSSSLSPLFGTSKKPRKKHTRPSSSPLYQSSLSSSSSSSSSGDIERQDPSTSTSTSTPTSTVLLDIREKLAKISNIASLLCVVDCTVLPIVTVIFPLIGLGASPAQAHWLHELGHSVALFFVLPVGGLAATMNYLSSKSMPLFSIATAGLSLIYAANGGHSAPLLSSLPHDLACKLHCGTVLHRSVNIIGCALLLSSNYFAHRLSCNHDHDHGHDHGHGHGHDGHKDGTKSCCDHDHDH
mmetsp:Transcript_17550/g.26259  ORF Transcript_17550/g.26259 Transcript_17550/m.26259 type:complete len:247 (+) Transcript_17550:101-841(+)